MNLREVIELAAGLAYDEDELQVVGRIQGEWAVANWEDAGRIAEMRDPTFRVNFAGVLEDHIQRGEITADWELPDADTE